MISHKNARKGSKTVVTITAAHGAVEVHIKERPEHRGSRYFAEYRDPVRGRRRTSLRTNDLDKAKEEARVIAEGLASAMPSNGTRPVPHRSFEVTLGELFDLYRSHRLSRLTTQGRPTGHCINMERVMRVAEVLWGRDLIVLDIDQRHIDGFEARRKAGGAQVPPPVLPGRHGSLHAARATTLGPCNTRTVRGELGLLSAINNWAMRHRVAGGGGVTLIPFNPFDRVSLPRVVEPRRKRVTPDCRPPLVYGYAPEAEDPARELPSRLVDDLHTALLQLALGTGRRLETILDLRVRDLLQTAAGT